MSPNTSDRKKQVTQTNTDKSKNVSHVPCKFFRQSTCQAGDKCPFSHEVDPEIQAVCKYFQNGNCKFGSKCALAHITPDGRHVNKRPGKDAKKKDLRSQTGLSEFTLRNNLATPKKDQLQLHSGSSPMIANVSSVSSNELRVKSPEKGPYEEPQNFSHFALTHSASHSSPTALPKPVKQKRTDTSSSQNSDVTVVDNSVELASQILSKYSSTSSRNGSFEAATGTLVSKGSMSFGQRHFSVPDIKQHVSPSDQLSHAKAMRPAISALGMRSLSASLPHYSSSITLKSGIEDGSAILDDDDDTFGDYLELDYREQEEDGFQEQLVPSALQDLLTPLERERRNSRSSQQKAGRPIPSPSSSLKSAFTIRKVSTSSEPMSFSASSTELWGPRNAVAPFGRTTAFGSPTQASSQLHSIQQHSSQNSPFSQQTHDNLPLTFVPSLEYPMANQSNTIGYPQNSQWGSFTPPSSAISGYPYSSGRRVAPVGVVTDDNRYGQF